MCSRYEVKIDPKKIQKRFKVEALFSAPLGERRPTDEILVIDADPDGGRRAFTLRWGFPVSWDPKPLINARAETLTERKTFRSLLTQRCLVPATAYYEWQREPKRLKYRIGPEGQEVFAFAGLIDGDACAIITCAPSAGISHIHDRMPVILDEASEAAWLDRSRPFAEVASFLAPYQPQLAAVAELPPPPRQGDLFG